MSVHYLRREIYNQELLENITKSVNEFGRTHEIGTLSTWYDQTGESKSAVIVAH